jgi:hypothetical protein
MNRRSLLLGSLSAGICLPVAALAKATPETPINSGYLMVTQELFIDYQAIHGKFFDAPKIMIISHNHFDGGQHWASVESNYIPDHLKGRWLILNIEKQIIAGGKLRFAYKFKLDEDLYHDNVGL